jgi:dTDP-glucose 4,6-dehydratase
MVKTPAIIDFYQTLGCCMRFLITGGAGFIGSAFVRNLLSGSLDAGKQHQVVVLDALTYAGNIHNLDAVKNSEAFEFIQGNILDKDIVNDLMPTVDVVVHFAAESHVDRSLESAEQFFLTNVIGTQNLLESARSNDLQRFLHVSTDEVYGSISTGSWDENCPLLPNSPYAASKAASDLAVRAYHKTYKLDTVITRCSNNYGPFQFPEKVIPLFITNLMNKVKVPLYGDGLNSRDWLHVDDHCKGIFLALTSGVAGEIYNIGGGTELTNISLTEHLLQAFDLGQEYIDKVPDRLGHDLRYSVDISKISKELGYSPSVDFKVGLSETIDWYKDHRSWWEPLRSKTH